MTKLGVPWADVGDVLVAHDAAALIIETVAGRPTQWVWLDTGLRVRMPMLESNDMVALLFSDRLLLKPDGSCAVGATCSSARAPNRAWHSAQGWLP